MNEKDDGFDFKPMGMAIKEARIKYGIKREDMADTFEIAPRYLAAIENEGKNPSLQLFYKIVTEHEISVDEFFYPEDKAIQSSIRRQIDAALDGLSDDGLMLIEQIAKSVRALRG